MKYKPILTILRTMVIKKHIDMKGLSQKKRKQYFQHYLLIHTLLGYVLQTEYQLQFITLIQGHIEKWPRDYYDSSLEKLKLKYHKELKICSELLINYDYESMKDIDLLTNILKDENTSKTVQKE